MIKYYHLDIVSAEEKIFSGLVRKIHVLGSEGAMDIYSYHSPLLSYVRPGIVHILTIDNDLKYLYLSGGILEVQPDIVTILADTAIRSEDLDMEKAIMSKKKVEECVRNFHDDMNYVQIAAEISRAIEKIKILEQIKK